VSLLIHRTITIMPLHILKKKRSKLLCVKIATLDADLEFRWVNDSTFQQEKYKGT